MKRFALAALVVLFFFGLLSTTEAQVHTAGYDTPIPGSHISTKPTTPGKRIPLVRSKDATSGDNQTTNRIGSGHATSVSSGAVSILASLGIVLGLFFVGAWVMRRATPGAVSTVPADVVEVLGRVNLMNRQSAQLLRIGNKIVLAVIAPSGTHTITEVTEPAEVERIVESCRGARDASNDTYRRLLRTFGGTKSPTSKQSLAARTSYDSDEQETRDA